MVGGLATLFLPCRLEKHRNSGKLNATASEILTLLPVLAQYVRQVYKNHDDVELLAFKALNSLVEHVHAGFSGKVTGADIFHLVEDSLQQWKNAGWAFRKKNHWLLHFHDRFDQHQCMVSCFAMERKHKFLSKKTTLVQNTKVFEASAMEEVTAGELYMLEQVDTLDNGIQILQPKTPRQKQTMELVSKLFAGLPLQAISTSTQARCQDGNVLAGDVALFAAEEGKWACGRVHQHAQCHGQAPMTAVTKFKLLEVHSHCACWEIVDNAPMMLVPLQNVFTSVTYAEDDKKITTLIPWRWR